MTRKLDPDKKVRPEDIDDVTSRKASSRPPSEWPGIPGRSEEDEAEFQREGGTEAPAEVTRAQRDLERSTPRKDPEQ